MGQKSEIDQIFSAMVNSGSIRITTQPAAAAATALVSDGAAAAWAWAAYVQIIAAAVLPASAWLLGISIHTGVVETWNGDIAVASGAAAAEVDLAMFHVVSGIPTAVGVSVATPTFLPFPVLIQGSPRMAARIRKDTAASAAGCSLKLIIGANIGN